METKIKKLNSRQWRLYNTLKDKTVYWGYLTKEMICELLPCDYKLEINTNQNGTTNTNCPTIYNDIKALNNSCEIEKIIVVKDNQIRLGNEQECRAYAEKLKEKALLLLERHYTLIDKINKDGQGKIVSCQGVAIDSKSKAREFVETFARE